MSMGSNLRSRTRDSSWQWLFIGVALGFGCAVVVCLAGYAAGLISINTGGAPAGEGVAAQPTVLVVSEEPLATETPAVQVLIVTSTPGGITVVAPSPTPPQPTEDPTLLAALTAEAGTGVELPTQAPGLGGTPLTTPTATLEGGLSPELANARTTMNLISGGDFQMGTTQQEAAAAVSVCINQHSGNCQLSFAEDSFPPHNVTLNSFYMEVTEVTVGQYVNFLNWLGPRGHLDGCFNQPCAATRSESEASNIEFDGAIYSVADLFATLPMTSVTWYGARAYCEAIGRRLPTEAEWERAARGSDGRVYPWGNEWNETLANTSRPVREDVGPVQVGSFPGGASPYGILDMAGNVGEWMSDWYSPSFYAQPAASGLNPQGPTAGTSKVVRGGHWDAVPFFARTVHRQEFDPTFQALYVGFRCVSDEAEGAAPGAAVPGGQTGAPAGGESGGQPAQAIPSPTPAVLPTDENITPSPLPSLPPGG